MRLLIVDDNVLFREGLVSLLKEQTDITVVGEAGCVLEAIKLARELSPDLILMDFGLPDGSGLDAMRPILAENPQINIVFLTIHEQDEHLFAAIRAGAKGYLLKNVSVSNLLDFLRRVEQGEAAISRTMVSHILQEFSRTHSTSDMEPKVPNTLTNRELEVLRELATGATNREIAQRLVITENTVKVHMHRILAKLSLKSRREVVRYARDKGLV